MKNIVLARLPAEDDRDEAYPLRSLLPAAEPSRTHRYWWDNGWWGNQRATPLCVAYAWLHLLEDGPITWPSRTPGHGPYVAPRVVYDRAQEIDEWPGNDYDGTSVRAGVKALRERGLISEYRWAWDLDSLVKAVLERGPVVVGTWWYSGMWMPDGSGFVRAEGRREGGHAYVVNGVNTTAGKARIKNSWGRQWGDEGRAWISFEDLERLIHENGEVCAPVEAEPEEVEET